MKKLRNIHKATISDVESDGLLEEATLLHVLAYETYSEEGKVKAIKGANHEKLRAFLKGHIEKQIPIVGHNFICYDVPLMEKLLDIDLSDLMVIDTLRLSWAINQDREIHGLDSFGKEYGIPKPKVSDWENLTYAEYRNRCVEDVKINSAMWYDHLEQLEFMGEVTLKAIRSGLCDGIRMNADNEVVVGYLFNKYKQEGTPKKLSEIREELGKEVQRIDRMKDPSYTVEMWVTEYLELLMFKGDMQRVRERERWKFDRKHAEEHRAEKFDLLEAAREKLESVMPKKAVYGVQARPKELYKLNGEPTAAGKRWQDACDLLENSRSYTVGVGKNKQTVQASVAEDDLGNPLVMEKIDSNGLPSMVEVKVLKKYLPANINSPEQVKKFLYSHGWRPQTFKWERPPQEDYEIWKKNNYRKDLKPKPRAIPQINIDNGGVKELCPSVVRLAEEVPEIMAYQSYTVIKHRYDLLCGMLKAASDDDYLKASCGGFTNTLRLKHRELVNLPGDKKPFAKGIRSSLTCLKGQVLLGSDLSSLEDRVKHHFAMAIDPNYVENVNSSEWDEEFKKKYEPDFDRVYDPHIEMAQIAGLITKKQFDEYMYVHGAKEAFERGDLTEKQFNERASKYDISEAKKHRAAGKTANYLLVYGGKPKTLAASAGIDLEVAEKLYEAYWKIHGYVIEIADSLFVFEDKKGRKWQVNPINGFCYSLRAEKDRFSTLIQGTGAYIFDMWLDGIQERMKSKFKRAVILGEFHDEYITVLKDKPKFRTMFEEITRDSLTDVNKTLMLRREMGCDVQFGPRYSDIH